MWPLSITWILLIVYSFTRQDLNLTFYRLIPDFLKVLGFYYRPLVTLIYLFLSVGFIIITAKLIHQKLPGKKRFLTWFVLLALLAIPAYPMFSYDIFNYLFNTKMVWLYHANPHLQTASQFTFDPMLRFMQNIHTPAPYAYGWTLVSLLPGLFWFTQKFTLSFWAMKLFVALFWFGQLTLLKSLIKTLFPHEGWRWWLFALSPLVLVETLINGHNDVVMMLPALLSFLKLLQSKKPFDKNHLLSLLWLLLSASVKYATVVLLPFWLLKHRLKNIDLPALSSLVLLAIIFTRPDQIHSWYLIWAFSWAVLAKNRWLVSLFTALTWTAILRYLPYIYFGSWDPPVYLYRQLIWLMALPLTLMAKRLIDRDYLLK